MPPLREEAETLRLGLLMGLVRPDEVIAWADRAIGESSAPPIEVIDIAIASGEPVDELVRLLKRVPGPADHTAAAHRVLGILRARLIGDGLPLEAAADMLWVYSTEANIPEDERQVAANISYQYDCLAYLGTPEGLSEEVGRFLAEHAAEPGTAA